MIKVVETIPLKLPGRSSFLLFFPFNPNLIERIKTYSPAIWHKKIGGWEISASYLASFLDYATTVDDIELQLLPDEIEEISESPLTKKEISEFKVTPYKHQIEAINYGLSHSKWLLLDSMGIGKSLESMYLAETLHKRGKIEHCLIICGVDSLRQHWSNEIKRFSSESAVVLGERKTKTGKITYETLAKRAEQVINPISEFFIITNIASLRDETLLNSIIKSKNKIDMIIVDEIHKCSRSSIQGSNLLKLDAKYKLGMSGTLILNSPISAYLPLAWTENDHSTLTNFKSFFCNFGGFHDHQIVGYKNLDILKDELTNCSLRRTFKEVRADMPSKMIEYESLEMSDKQSKFYEAVKNGVKEEANKITLNTNNLLALMTRLRQATSCPNLLTTEDIPSIKVERAAEIAEELLEQGEKVTIMSNFKEPVYALGKLLKSYKPAICTGDQSEGVVNKCIDDFRNSDNFNLLIGTMAKIGTGFSFPECHYMIFIDQPYTQALFDQCCDRIYRITSKDSVFIKVLVTMDTVDERVKEIVDTKKELSDFIVDDKISDQFSTILKDIILDL